jgi:hypothetical protein
MPDYYEELDIDKHVDPLYWPAPKFRRHFRNVSGMHLESYITY